LNDAKKAAVSRKKEGVVMEHTYQKIFDLAILGGQLVMPEYGVIHGDIYVNDGKVAAVSTKTSLPAKQTICAEGRYVLPGIVDPHIHLGLMSPMREELEKETAAALIGGVTTTGLYVSASDARLGAFEKLADDIHSLSHININPHFIIAREDQLCELPQMIELYGIRSFKVYMHGVPGVVSSSEDSFIVRVMQALRESGKDCMLCVHCENHSLVCQATEFLKNKTGNLADITDWECSHPEMAEEEAIQRISYYAKKLRQKVYIVHVSSEGGVKMLRMMKKDNPYLFGETTSPYLSLSLENNLDYHAKMEPPIRGRRHQDALWRALSDGVIDTIGTDNVMIPDEMKYENRSDIWKIPSGYSVLETHLPSMLSEGVLRRGIPIHQIAAKMTMEPAKIFGIYPRKGSLQPGSDADITIVNLNAFEQVRAENLHSGSGFSIFEGSHMAGWPCMTVLGGKIAVADREIVNRVTGQIVL